MQRRGRLGKGQRTRTLPSTPAVIPYDVGEVEPDEEAKIERPLEAELSSFAGVYQVLQVRAEIVESCGKCCRMEGVGRVAEWSMCCGACAMGCRCVWRGGGRVGGVPETGARARVSSEERGHRNAGFRWSTAHDKSSTSTIKHK